MLNISKIQDFTDYLYGRLPLTYRVEDSKQKDILYRYLYSLVAGGYNRLVNSNYKTIYKQQYDETGSVIKKTLPDGTEVADLKEVKVLESLGIKDLSELINPLTCPEDIFPYLYECFGLEYMDAIDIKYQRRFLCNVGYMNAIKGSLTETRFIASVLTGMRNDAWYEKDPKTGDRQLFVLLYAETIQDIQNIKTSGHIVEQFLKTRIPFYLMLNLNIQITGNFILSESHFIEKLVTTKGYNLYEKEVE